MIGDEEASSQSVIRILIILFLERYCNRCKEHREATKQMSFWSLPAILVIHLKRFVYTRYWRDKIDLVVKFPVDEILDMSEFETSKQPTPPHYRLFAVSNHMGGLGVGHYTASAKHGDHWFHFNDSHVSSMRSTEIGGSDAYVLFYRREDLKWTDPVIRKEELQSEESTNTINNNNGSTEESMHNAHKSGAAKMANSPWLDVD